MTSLLFDLGFFSEILEPSLLLNKNAFWQVNNCFIIFYSNIFKVER